MLLAIDTSTRVVGVALYDGSEVLGELIWQSHNYHTVELAPAVSDLLRRGGVVTGSLQAVAVALGPGSFTGLRIGLALAKGLVLAQKMSLVGVPTLDVLAAAQPLRPVKMAAVVRAGRGRLAVGWYVVENGVWKSVAPVEVRTASELNQSITEPTYICGELTEEEKRLLGRKRKNVILASPAQSLRRPGYLAELGWLKWQAGEVDDIASLSPIYLHYNDPIPG